MIRGNRFWRMLLGALILLVSVAAFSRCFDYGLVNLDDYGYLLVHAKVKEFAGWESVVWFFTDVSEAIWMPLTWASYALDYWLFGAWYGGFHVHSAVVHALNAFLLWWLLMTLFPQDDRKATALCCFFAALAWGIHPLRCESVVFLASRKDVLSFFWELLALIAWVRGSQCGSTKRRVLLTAASVGCFAVGAMCKPSVMTFPLLCLLLDAFVVRQIRPLRYLVPFVLMVALGVFAGWQQSSGGATAAGAGETLVQRLAVATAAFGIYLRNTAVPLWLAPQCIKQWPDWPRFLLPGIVLSATWGAFLVRRTVSYWSRRGEVVSVERLDDCPVRLTFGIDADYVLTGMAWFALAIAPMLGLANFGYHAHADRFTYIPSVGLALLLAYGLMVSVRRFGTAVASLTMACVLSALAALTWWQTGFWQDDAKLFTRTVEIDGDRNVVAHRNLGMYYFEMTHELEKACRHFDLAEKANMQVVLSLVYVHMMALEELGKNEEMDALMRRIDDELVRCYGREGAIALLHPLADVERETEMKGVYQMAKILTWFGSKPSLGAARRELESMRERYSQHFMWQYLMWRYLTLAGEREAAAKMRETFLDTAQKTGDYLRFRYLRGQQEGQALLIE